MASDGSGDGGVRSVGAAPMGGMLTFASTPRTQRRQHRRNFSRRVPTVGDIAACVEDGQFEDIPLNDVPQALFAESSL
jgi:hypothetical protein